MCDSPEVPVELKYCEFCGSLWLRARESSQSYCERCAEWIRAELPQAAGREA